MYLTPMKNVVGTSSVIQNNDSNCIFQLFLTHIILCIHISGIGANSRDYDDVKYIEMDLKNMFCVKYVVLTIIFHLLYITHTLNTTET